MMDLIGVRSREYRFTHMNCFTVGIPFLSEALSGERIWVILKVANLKRKVWWLWQEEKEKKEKKLIWRLAQPGNWTQSPAWKARALTTIPRPPNSLEHPGTSEIIFRSLMNLGIELHQGSLTGATPMGPQAANKTLVPIILSFAPRRQGIKS